MIEDKQDQAIGDQTITDQIDDPPVLVHKVGALRGSPKYLPGKGSGIKRKRDKHGAFRRVVRLTGERRALILTYLRRGSHLETAFASAGVPASTYRSWMIRANEAVTQAEQGIRISQARKELILFLSDVEMAQAQFEQSMLDVVAGAAHAGTYTAALALLERRFPDRWQKREENQGSINVNVGFSFVQVSADQPVQALPGERSDDPAPGDPIPASHQLSPGAPQDIVVSQP